MILGGKLRGETAESHYDGLHLHLH